VESLAQKMRTLYRPNSSTTVLVFDQHPHPHFGSAYGNEYNTVVKALADYKSKTTLPLD